MPILNKRANKTPLGLYVHVPFCRSKCQYCDFYSMATKDDKLMDGYLDAVCDHIKEAGELAPGYKVDSVYFGGGTPSFFGADGLAVILTTIRRNFDVVPDAEISVECNPDSVSGRSVRRRRNSEKARPSPHLHPGRHRLPAHPQGGFSQRVRRSDVRPAGTGLA